jgi:hypothetical protein
VPERTKKPGRESAGERAARIEMILEELRLNTEDLHELGRAVTQRMRKHRAETRVFDGARQAKKKHERS